MDYHRSSWLCSILIISVLQITLTNAACSRCVGKCKGTKLDLAFVLDGSGSICNDVSGSCQNWENILQFISGLSEFLDISQDNDRIALVQFGNDATVEFPLSRNTDLSTVIADIKDTPYKDEQTNTSGGLYVLRTQVMKEARPDAVKVAVVITDGVSNLDQGSTLSEANLAHKDNIRIYSIGVTKMIDVNEVRRISSAPQIVNTSYFTIPDFNTFSPITFVEKLHATVCVDYDANAQVANCPGAYTNTGCYVVTDTGLSRSEAQNNCALLASQIGRPGMGDLVSIPTQEIQEEMEWLVSARWEKSLTPASTREFWVGGHRDSALFGGKDYTYWTWVSKSANEVTGPQGCFADKPASSSTDLPDVNVMSKLTPGNCSDLCLSKGYTVMGLQGGKLCFCGNSYGSYGRSNRCTVSCPGEPNTMCGGSDSSNIYILNGAYGSWAPGQPNTFDDRNQACGALEGRDDTDAWRMGDEVCYKKFPYLCSLPGISQTRCNQDGSGNIRRYLGDKCIYISRDMSEEGKKDWFGAKRACDQLGGELLVINSQFLHDQVRLALNQELGFASKNKIWFWVGLLGKKWLWPSGNDFYYTRWAPDEPSDFAANCMKFKYDASFNAFYWSDGRCSEKLSSICVIDMVTALAPVTATEAITTTPAPTTNGTGGANLGASLGASTNLTDDSLNLVLIIVLVLVCVIGIIIGIVACCYYNKRPQQVVPKTALEPSNVLIPYNKYYQKDEYDYDRSDAVYSNIYDTYTKPIYDVTPKYAKTTYGDTPIGKYTVRFTAVDKPVPLPRIYENFMPRTGLVVNPTRLEEDHAYISYNSGGTGGDTNTKYGKRAQSYTTSYEVQGTGGGREYNYVKPQNQLTSSMTSETRSARMTSRESGTLVMSRDGMKLSSH